MDPQPSLKIVPAPVSFEPKTGQLTAMKVLIVDDDHANVALMEAMLDEAGYKNVTSITDSRLALETCRSFQPDLVLLDLMMPYIDGFEVLESLRLEAGEIFLPVIILTADTNGESRLRAMHAGATDFLLKPLDHSEVLLRIANASPSMRS